MTPERPDRAITPSIKDWAEHADESGELAALMFPAGQQSWIELLADDAGTPTGPDRDLDLEAAFISACVAFVTVGALTWLALAVWLS